MHKRLFTIILALCTLLVLPATLLLATAKASWAMYT